MFVSFQLFGNFVSLPTGFAGANIAWVVRGWAYRVSKVLDDVRLHADDVTVGNDEVGGGKMLDDDAQFVSFMLLNKERKTCWIRG